MKPSLNIDQSKVWYVPQLDDLRLMRARYVQHAFKPHAHDYYVLGIIEDGLQTFAHGRNTLVTAPGKLIIINPEEVHTGEAATTTGFTYRALYPSKTLMDSFASAFTAKTSPSPHFHGGLIHDADVFNALQHLHHLSETPPTLIALEDALTHFFVSLIHRHAGQRLTLKTYHAAPQAIRIVCEYIEAHFADNISLSQLAGLVNISAFHLARLFRRHIGMPPHTYLENVRIRHVERLLFDDMPLADIAFVTGFSSQSHLNKTFKRFIGTTPGEYRQKRKIV